MFLAVFALAPAALAGPRVYDVGLAVTNLADAAAQTGQLYSPGFPLEQAVESELEAMVVLVRRCRPHPWWAQANDRGYAYGGQEPVDFVVHLVVHRFACIYRNRLVSRYYVAESAGAAQSPFEVLSYPAVAGRFELRLVRPGSGDVRWSATHDSTLLVPYDPTRYIYNPEKYPGWTSPRLLQEHLAGLIRLQNLDPTVGSAMNAADVWFISSPGDAAATARRLLQELMSSFARVLDAHLPLEGRVARVQADGQDGTRAVLDIGAQDGVTRRLRLDVRRGVPASVKVGQLEVVEVDSTTAVARLRKLEKPFRKRGEGLQVGDTVVSRERDAAP